MPPRSAPEPAARYRLTPGTTVLAVAEGWIVHTPSQAVLEIGCPDSDRPTVAAFLDDPTRPPPVDSAAILAPLIDYLKDEQALENDTKTGDGQACAVWCDPTLDPTLVETVLTHHHIDQVESPSAPLLAVAGWLPDARWCAFDQAAVDSDTWWLPVHAEGDTWYAGPLRMGAAERSAGYRDLRLRRLAASPCPARLDQLWRSARPPATPLHHLAPLTAALECAIGALRPKTQGWDDGLESASSHPASHPALVNHQVAFGPDGTRREHPVLPVPLHLTRDRNPGAATSR